MTPGAGRPTLVEVTTGVRVRVPASSANLGPGFDALGLALGLYDEVVVVPADAPGVTVEVVGEGAAEVPRDETHLVVRAMRATFDRLGVRPAAGLAMTCENKIPHGRGLGSSSAAIVAGIVAARALVPDGASRLPTSSALALASELEGHPDNVAACLLGGLTVAWTAAGPDASGAAAVRLDPPRATVVPVVFVPSAPVATVTARGVLPASVPHGDAAVNAGRTALLVALLSGKIDPDPELLLIATEDRLHQPYRAATMPGSYALVEDLRASGVPAVISGAGPTVLAFTDRDSAAKIAGRAPGDFRAYVLEIDQNGAVETRLSSRE